MEVGLAVVVEPLVVVLEARVLEVLHWFGNHLVFQHVEAIGHHPIQMLHLVHSLQLFLSLIFSQLGFHCCRQHLKTFLFVVVSVQGHFSCHSSCHHLVVLQQLFVLQLAV